MRLDRWLRLKIGKIPQGLVEKYLRTGKIKLNKKKVKSSFKVKTKDEINLFNIEFKESIQQKKIKFSPSKEIIKSKKDTSHFNEMDDMEKVKKSWDYILPDCPFDVDRYNQLTAMAIKVTISTKPELPYDDCIAPYFNYDHPVFNSRQKQGSI